MHTILKQTRMDKKSVHVCITQNIFPTFSNMLSVFFFFLAHFIFQKFKPFGLFSILFHLFISMYFRRDIKVFQDFIQKLYRPKFFFSDILKFYHTANILPINIDVIESKICKASSTFPATN